MELISREECKDLMIFKYRDDPTFVVNEALRTINQVRTIEDRPTGKWIDHSEDGYAECPFCHEATNCDGNIEKLHYCWNCGAELGVNMRGAK